MATPLDFDSYVSARAPTAGPRAPDVLNVPGMGAILRPDVTYRTPGDHELSFDEKAILEPLGYAAGDSLPGDFAAKLAAALAESAAARQDTNPVPPGTPAFRAPTPTDIASLPPAKQAELRAAIKDATRYAAAATAAPPIADAGPGINEALAVAARAEAAAPAARPNPYHDPDGLYLPPARPLAPPPTPPPAPEPDPPPDTGALLTVANCPHCGWDLEKPDEIEAGPLDVHAYLAMLLGGAGVRFRKDVPLFGGRVVATFRTLTVTETDLVDAQIGHDYRAGKVTGAGDYLKQTHLYRLALGLERLALDNRGAAAGPAAVQAGPDGDAPTILPRLVAWLHEQALPSESLRRAVVREYARFQALVEKLEARAADPGFWPGIGSPG